jgi:AcrR family transcriptional regulator
MSDPKRVDGRRNYERLLDEARAAFAEYGTDVSLRYVARRAGVGVATLYRHFPSRGALVEAVLRPGLDGLAARAGELLDAESPGDALTEWLHAFAATAARYQGLPAALLAASPEALRVPAGRLLARAQRAGAVRSDLTVGEVLALGAAAAWAASQQPPPAAEVPTPRFLALLSEGLAPAEGGA